MSKDNGCISRSSVAHTDPADKRTSWGKTPEKHFDTAKCFWKWARKYDPKAKE